MRFLQGEEEQEALKWLEHAAELAVNSECRISRCGSIIVKDRESIGEGWNRPPLGRSIDYCLTDKLPARFKSDPHCCLHAEQVAITDAMLRNPKKLEGSRIYFMRLDANGDKTKAGPPYCTICSKIALEAGISEWVLDHKDIGFYKAGIYAYSAESYNEVSFHYQGY
jgi:deoxycytidylate deaminase